MTEKEKLKKALVSFYKKNEKMPSIKWIEENLGFKYYKAIDFFKILYLKKKINII